MSDSNTADTRAADTRAADTRAADSNAASQFEILADMSQDFAASLDIDDTLSRGLERITHHVGAEGGALFLLDDSGETLECTASFGGTEITGLTLGSGEGIVGRCVQGDTAEIVRDVQNDANFYQAADAETGFITRSILCAAMTVKDRKIGAIELVNKDGGDGLFDESDLRLLQSLSASAALAIHNARMASELVEQEKVKRELELAAEIQRSLLPEARPHPFPVAGLNFPARMVSGDFFDFFELDDGRIAFNLGDVSGKGMNAALMMAKTSSLFRCLGKKEHRPGKLLALVNDEICETATRGMFVTMVGGIFDPANGTIVLANAGHEPPLHHHKDGSYTAIEAEAPPIGILPGMADGDGFPEITLNLDDGALYVFTDGLTEGYVEDGRELEVGGLQQLIVEFGALPLGERIDAILGRVNTGDAALRDDLTMLGIERA